MTVASMMKGAVLASWPRADWIGDLASWIILARLRKHTPVALGVGLPRTGTHTIAESWDGNIAAHEAQDLELIDLLLKHADGKISDKRLKTRLKCRWRMTRVDFDVFHALHHLLNVLPDEEQPTRFVLTVREPTQWLPSEMNQNYLTREMPNWVALEEYRYGRYRLDLEQWDTPELQQYVRWPVRAYFRYWNDHIVSVLKSVDREKLLIGQPNMMPDFLLDVADFCGFDKSLVKLNHHGGKGSRQIPRALIPDYDILSAIISEECGTALSMLDEEGFAFEH